MKFFSLILILVLLIGLCAGCQSSGREAQIAATTLPVYEFTVRLCDGTGLTVTQLVTESVSCLHDYSLNVRQVRTVEAAELIIINGAGLEDFMSDLLADKSVIDSSMGIALLECHEHHDHGHEDHGHNHETDSHIWLSPENAMVMAQNICAGLSDRYPEHRDRFAENLASLTEEFRALQTYAEEQLSDLSCRELITFHDGFAYFAQAFDLTILEAVEEESGSEASAAELKELIALVEDHHLPAIFTEELGSVSAAGIISAETGATVYPLDMAMHADSYFEAIYHNIDTVKEALGCDK